MFVKALPKGIFLLFLLGLNKGHAMGILAGAFSMGAKAVSAGSKIGGALGKVGMAASMGDRTTSGDRSGFNGTADNSLGDGKSKGACSYTGNMYFNHKSLQKNNIDTCLNSFSTVAGWWEASRYQGAVDSAKKKIELLIDGKCENCGSFQTLFDKRAQQLLEGILK